MENHDNIVLKVLLMKNGRTNNKRLHKIYEGKYPNILEYIDNRFPDMIERKEVFIRMRLKIEKRPVCLKCGGIVGFKGFINDPFAKYCCNRCKENDINKQLKTKETWYRKYGVRHISSLSYIKENKIKTCLKNFGVKYPMQSKEIQQKSRNTCMDKYGVEYTGQIEEVKNKIKEICSKKYGVSSYVMTKECKEKAHSNNARNKRYNTMSKNNSYNTSKPEEELYLYIKEKFHNVKRQYKDSIRYPWACDFYIPELDYFIELNGNWTHGKHPFSSTPKEDLYIVKEWKERSVEHPYYSNAIKTWTIYDVKKRNYAKEHNLNFKEVWSLEEGKDFIDSLQ